MDWAPGDLALCIKMGAWHPIYVVHETPLAVAVPGGIYTVTSVLQSGTPTTLYWPNGTVGLGFSELGHDFYFSGRAFRKIPQREADAFDHEIIEALSGQPFPVSHAAPNDAAHNSFHREDSNFPKWGEQGRRD